MGMIFDNPQDRPRRYPQPNKPPEGEADDFVLTVFTSLQKIWRARRDCGRRSLDELELWKKLARYLTQQDNWA